MAGSVEFDSEIGSRFERIRGAIAVSASKRAGHHSGYPRKDSPRWTVRQTTRRPWGGREMGVGLSL